MPACSCFAHMRANHGRAVSRHFRLQLLAARWPWCGWRGYRPVLEGWRQLFLRFNAALLDPPRALPVDGSPGLVLERGIVQPLAPGWAATPCTTDVAHRLSHTLPAHPSPTTRQFCPAWRAVSNEMMQTRPGIPGRPLIPVSRASKALHVQCPDAIPSRAGVQRLSTRPGKLLAPRSPWHRPPGSRRIPGPCAASRGSTAGRAAPRPTPRRSGA
jgi:hypothetical protein